MLDAWTASAARFREDANAEEALVVGGYAGRVLVELASNAVDAAMEQGVPARIRVRTQDGELRVANTGAPLTAQGVAGLASLRASAKRDTLGSVGHFGVGFTAVLSWSAAPRVVSRTGGVRFDHAATAAAIAAVDAPAVHREAALRGGSVPVLRLPWPTSPDEEGPPDGFTTEVRLPLLAGAVADVERFLNDPAAAEDLFWALPDLAEIDLPDRVLRCGVDDDGLTVLDDGERRVRYRTARSTGSTPPELLADRPIEERRRAGWAVTWAYRVPPDGADDADVDLFAVPPEDRSVAGWTVGAPTPTDEPLTLPARLVGTFPVDDTRRRLAPGPLCEFLLERAAETYLDLILAVDPVRRWELLPAGGFPAGPVDGALRAAIVRRVEVTPLLRSALDDPVSVRQACMLPGLGGRGAELFGQAITGLLPPQPPAALDALRALGVQTLGWSQASAAMAGIDRDPTFWRQVYDAVATAESAPRGDDLADLPVPIVGGRRVLGARGCLLPSADVAGLARRAGELVPGLRIVDPAAAHPYLERLGARPADPDALLADPAMVAALDRMRADLEDVDPDPGELRDLASVVLDLIAAGGRGHRDGASGTATGHRSGGTGTLAAELVLTTDDGQPWPASELLMPDSDLAAVLAPDADRPTVGGSWLARYSADVLVAAGVRAGFAVVVLEEPTDPAVADLLPDFEDWLDRADPASTAGQLAALADLDVVDPDRWPQALRLIAADRDARACVLQGRESYSGWWLSRHVRIEGRPPGYWRLPDAVDLDGLYDPLPIRLDREVARAVGVRSGLAETAAADPEDLLDRLADPHRTLPPARVAAVTAAVVRALADIDDVDLPAGVRTLSGRVADPGDDDVCVLDRPWLAQVLSPGRLVPGGADPALVAGVLDLPLASARCDARVVEDLTREPGGRDRLERAAASVGLDLGAVRIESVRGLSVLLDGAEVAVRWWADGDGLLIDGSADGAGRAVAWAAGRWEARDLAVAAAAEDGVALAEDSVQSPPDGQMLSSSAI